MRLKRECVLLGGRPAKLPVSRMNIMVKLKSDTQKKLRYFGQSSLESRSLEPHSSIDLPFSLVC